MSSHFFALFSRMKYIDRWSLMRNTDTESLSQHSFDVSAIAHALAVIGNRRLGKSYDTGKVALTGMYHDMPEIITGDMPTPVKYYSRQIKEAYDQVEDDACNALLDMLPEDLRTEYAPYFIKQDADRQLWKFVKAADKICAYTRAI